VPPGLTLVVRPNVTRTLQRLRDAGCALGILSDIGRVTPEAEQEVATALRGAELIAFFEPGLLLFGEKNSPAVFSQAVERAGRRKRPNSCAFVGESQRERALALQAGLAAFPSEIVIFSRSANSAGMPAAPGRLDRRWGHDGTGFAGFAHGAFGRDARADFSSGLG
jgi:phosphoglycolate phosphatase-like HAD superfamily hydrolase